MLSILLAVCAQGWRYDGFAHEAATEVAAGKSSHHAPSPRGGPDPGPGPEAPLAPPVAPRPAPEILDIPTPTPSPPSAGYPAPTPTDVPHARAAPKTSPVSRLADEGGRIWEHPDPDWLRRWVAAKNEELRLHSRQAAPSAGATRRFRPLRLDSRPTPR